MKTIRCSGINKKDKRCKHTCILPIEMKWTCVDHTIDYEANTMEESKAKMFYIVEKDKCIVMEIRRKFYLEGQIRYLILTPQNARYVDREEFYHIPNGYTFVIVNQ